MEFQITLLDAMVMVNEVWDDKVSVATIRSCFRHCGFFQSPTVVRTNEETAEAEVSKDFWRLRKLHVVDPDLNVGDVVAVSAELITSHFPEENVIEVEAEDETENDKDDCCDPPPWVTTGKAEAAAQLLKIFTLQHDLDDIRLSEARRNS